MKKLLITGLCFFLVPVSCGNRPDYEKLLTGKWFISENCSHVFFLENGKGLITKYKRETKSAPSKNGSRVTRSRCLNRKLSEEEIDYTLSGENLKVNIHKPKDREKKIERLALTILSIDDKELVMRFRFGDIVKAVRKD